MKEVIISKKHVVGVRMSEQEINIIKARSEKEHLGCVSTLVRKATFWYINYMDKLEEKESNDK